MNPVPSPRVDAISAGLFDSAAIRLARVSIESSSRNPSAASSSDRSTSPARRAWAPTRRASAATAARSARFAWRTASTPGDHRHHEQHRGPGEQGSQPAVLAGLLARPLLGGSILCSFSLGAAVEEVPLRCGQVGVGSGLPLEGLGEPDTAIELAVGPIHPVPGVSRQGQVRAGSRCPSTSSSNQLPKARPGPRQGLVGQLDGVVVAGHQAGTDEELDEPLVLGVRGHGAAWDPAAHRFPLGGGGDQAQEQVAQQRPLLLGTRVTTRTRSRR